MFERIARGLGQSQYKVLTSEIELTDLAAIKWDNLPFCLALDHIVGLSPRMEIATRVIKNLRLLSRIAEYQHVEIIRVGPYTFGEIELELVLEPGLSPEITIQVASTFDETSDVHGQRHIGLTVDSNGWRYVGGTFFRMDA